MAESGYLSSREAAEALGITVQTLYSYVSRGLLRSEETAGPSRARRYRVEDVQRLKQRSALRRDPARAVQGALRYGSPVLDSGITLIQDGRLYYRGHDALDLAVTRSFEEVAALLWRGDFDTRGLFAQESIRTRGYAQVPVTIGGFQTVLARAAEEDLAAYDLSPASVAQCGGRILRAQVGVITRGETGHSIAGALARAWAPDREAATTLLSAALILCADHELNVSAFTARCVASAGATPYAAVIGGLAALSGFRHGGHTERVELLFREAGRGARAALASYGRRGESVPGFHHPLYPDGDPRCRLLLKLVQEYLPDSPALATAWELSAALEETVGVYPTVDFGLVTLARALDLPANGALLLFAVGRTAGWLGHAIEQYESNHLIRPRARYTGPPAGMGKRIDSDSWREVMTLAQRYTGPPAGMGKRIDG